MKTQRDAAYGLGAVFIILGAAGTIVLQSAYLLVVVVAGIFCLFIGKMVEK